MTINTLSIIYFINNIDYFTTQTQRNTQKTLKSKYM